MKKRWIASLLAACMLLFLLPSLALADAYGIPGSICDQQGHRWERTGFSEPTCTEDGYVYYKCSRCGETRREDDRRAWGHNWGEWTVTKEPTCLEKGEREHTCLRCGKTAKESLRKTDHAWSEWNVLSEPQDVPGVQEPGVRERACSVCGRSEQERFYPYGTQIRKGEHDAATVSAFQQMLEWAGYRPGTVNGTFTKTTETAVKAFQKDAGCKQDGIFWPCMWELLNKSAAGGGDGDGSGGKALPATAAGSEPEIIVKVDSAPLSGSAYGFGEEVRLEIQVKNGSDWPFFGIDLFCSKDDGGGMLASGVFLPADSLPLLFYAHHRVTMDEVNAGELTAETWLTFPSASGDPKTIEGNDVTVKTKGFTYPTLTVKEASDPLDGNAYGFGETVLYDITIENPTQWDCEDASVYNTQNQAPSGAVTEHNVFPAYLAPSVFHAQHTVTAEDIEAGELTAKTWLLFTNPAGDWITVDGNDVTVKTKGFTWPKMIAEEASTPLDGEDYGFNETISYKITFENDTQWSCDHLDLFCSQQNGGPQIAWDLFIAPDSMPITIYAFHTVTMFDVTNGEVTAKHWFNFKDPSGAPHTIDANDVTVKTKGFTYPTLSVEVISDPFDGDAYGFGETIDYQITLTNDTQWALSDTDLFNDRNDSGQITWGYFVGPYSSELTFYAHHVVNLYDLGQGEVAAHTWVNFTDEAGYPQTVNGNDVTVKTKEFTLPTLEAKLVSPEPAEGFEMNDVITVEVTVANPTQWPYLDVDVYTDVCELPMHRVVKGAYISSMSTNPFLVNHTVTAEEVAAGKIVNSSWADLKDLAGREYTIWAEDLVIKIRPFDLPEVKITEASAPLNGAYELSENILFDIEIQNATGWMFTNVEEYNGLLAPPTYWHGTIPVIGAYNTMGYIVSHTVTPADTAAGSVTDTAWIYAVDPANVMHVIHAKDLTVKVKKDVSDTVPVPPIAAEPHAGDHCVRSMAAHAEGLPVWEIAPCAEHGALLEDTYARIEAAGGDAEALTAALAESANLWYNAIDALYAEWIGTDPASEDVILADREAFYTDAVALMQAMTLARPVTDRTVIEALVELMADKCATLCYEIHTAPGARLDTARAGLSELARDPEELCGVRYAYDGSVFTQTAHACEEHAGIAALAMKLLLSAGEEEREAVLGRIGLVWKAELDARCCALLEGAPASLTEAVRGVMRSFARLLEARGAALNALYPDDPAAVRELLSQQIMLRALRLCALERELG